ncbi:MAG: hypothetical protein QOJ53_134 [Sphingomonadales bacterium]|jgi:hypothetical protein|nr:hypothetical protein [Sphingomonadales bacterium]
MSKVRARGGPVDDDVNRLAAAVARLAIDSRFRLMLEKAPISPG